ncbi:signal peptidase II [Enhygromyxa salina]|uniref:Lipoprotein signal peptidase n=1 Tax=Enhygromyxa salina TaxID=215803 RepID=A0A2S9YS82_9BACT|nr:signal peptidase II [Enhygromyxa salina]PRQ07899.1 Lipoprotein signal peptidase [Enhygromyxa salina]
MLAALTLLATLGADLASKHWVWTQLRPRGDSVALLGSTLELSFAFNRGTAFSVVREVQYPMMFLPITILVVGLTAFIALRSPGVDRLRMLALGLVSGGALGNLYDRLFRVDALGDHGVVDFIRLNYPWGGSWPSFNLADTALVIGTLLLMLSLSRADGPRA